MDSAEIVAELKRLRVPHAAIGEAIGRDRTAATKIFGKAGRTVKEQEKPALIALIAKYGGSHIGNTPDLPEADRLRDYVEVEVLPTYAGMGGGGTGDADRATSLLPRTLVEQELRSKASSASA